mgnify:CR=1 FL=1
MQSPFHAAKHCNDSGTLRPLHCPCYYDTRNVACSLLGSGHLKLREVPEAVFTLHACGGMFDAVFQLAGLANATGICTTF